jgi:hypothetical protein
LVSLRFRGFFDSTNLDSTTDPSIRPGRTWPSGEKMPELAETKEAKTRVARVVENFMAVAGIVVG